MKKVLSVLLAAAMVMGMSVSAFAANNTANGYVSFGTSSGQCWHDENGNTTVPVSNLKFEEAFWVNNFNDSSKYTKANIDKLELHVGDVLYFKVMNGDEWFQYNKPDIHWDINIKSKNVQDAYFKNIESLNNQLVVVVEIVDELDNLKAQDVKFDMYISDDKGAKNNKQSAGVSFELKFDNYKEEYVSFDFTNDVDYAAKWIVEKDKKGTAVFDFENAAYFTVKMISEEKVILNFSQAYDKDIDKAYNEYDADLEFYNFKGTKDEFTKVGELFIPADEDTYIYEIVDGEVVEVEAEYVEDYKVDSDKLDGWVIKTKELGYYVVADEELVVEEAEDNTNSSTSTDKTNPETGANDFVGAAVALAVVSVAAAGALAFKK